LSSVKLSNSLTTIPSCAFVSCENLKDITISDNVTNIEDYAFFDCKNLSSATIGNGIKNIGSQAFGYCNNLEIITIFAVEPPTAEEITPGDNFSGTFQTWNYENTDLRVPAESIEKYRTAPVWENFFKDRNPLTAIEGVEAAEGAESEVVARYDLSGRPVADDYRGMTIVRRAYGSTAKEILR